MIIRGKVQKVGYRASIFAIVADGLPNVSGYVKNLSNGDVEIAVKGDSYEVTQVIDFAYKGSTQSKVEGVEVIEIHPSALDGYENFIILR